MKHFSHLIDTSMRTLGGALLLLMALLLGCAEDIQNTEFNEGRTFGNGLFFGIKSGIVFRDATMMTFDLSLQGDTLTNAFNEFSPNMATHANDEISPPMLSAYTGFAWEVCQRANSKDKGFFANIDDSFTENGLRSLAAFMAPSAGYVKLPETLFNILLQKSTAIYNKGIELGRSEAQASDDAYNAACTAMFTAMNALQG